MASDAAAESFNCGVIFITKTYSMILECKSCIDKFGVYSLFLDHIFDKHVDDWFANDAKNTTRENSTKTQQVVADSSTTAESAERFHCGEIFITKNFCMMIECNACDGIFGVYPEFLDHIFDKHFDEWTTNAKNTTKNSSETSILHDELEANDEQYVVFDATVMNEDTCSTDNVDELITEILQPMEYAEGNEVIVTEIIEVEPQALPTAAANKIANKNLREVRQLPLKNVEKERKHKCKTCGFAFSDLFNLRSHELRHSTIKPFTCVKCDKGFYSNTELKTHLRRHTGEKPFVCPYCGKGFVTSGLLTMHERRHTNTRDHKCNKCDKSFFDRYQLKTHTLVHTKERNLTCKVCQAKFGRPNSLRTHMKLHENALGYECLICGLRFNQRPTLLWHIKSKHKVMNKEDDKQDLSESNNTKDDE